MKNEKNKITKNHLSNAKPLLAENCVTEKEAALYIGMSRSFLRQDRLNRTLKNRTPGPSYLKFGKSVRFRKSDLDDWINQHKVERF